MTQKSHQLADDGKRRVKQRRGWSSRKRTSSHTLLDLGTIMEKTQRQKRRMTGKALLPAKIRNDMTTSGRVDFWNEIMLSGVRVKPRSVKAELAVKKAHHVLVTPTDSGMGPYVLSAKMYGSKKQTAMMEKPQK
jgi:hypothetical protein